MKQASLIFCLLTISLAAGAQDSLSVARLKTLKGVIAPFSTIAKKDSLFLICFWSTSSEESLSEMNNLNTDLPGWSSTVPFRFMGVCVDEGKLANKLRPTYNMNGWTMDVYLDLYGEFRRALGSNNLPQSMILYKNKIVYQQSGWSAGSDNYLLERLAAIYHKRP